MTPEQTPQSVTEWLDWFEQVHRLEMDMQLERIDIVARRLGIREVPFPLITVGGTNGKGSTVTLLEGILSAANYRVGATVSPHLLHFNERIRIDRQSVDDTTLCRLFAEVESARGEQRLTYFEFAMLAAVLGFVQAEVDVAVLEVGLGGRLDAANLWDSAVAIVTNVALDHEQWLGRGRENIGREKAGIARSGCALIIGDRAPPDSLLSEARRRGARPLCLGVDFDVQREAGGTWRLSGQGSTALPELPPPAMPGPWQYDNAALALMALQQLDLAVPQTALAQGLSEAQIAGRFQRLTHRQRQVVLDVGHNPAAAHAGVAALRELGVSGRILAVSAIMQDKDYAEVARIWHEAVDTWLVGDLTLPRALAAEDYAELLEGLGAQAQRYDSLMAAWHAAFDQAGAEDCILVFGSFVTVSAVLQDIYYENNIVATHS